jgi:hypothetical protein
VHASPGDAAAHLSVPGARGNVEPGYFVVKGLVAAISCQGLDDSVHDFHAGFPAGVPQLSPLGLGLLQSLPPVVHLCVLGNPVQIDKQCGEAVCSNIHPNPGKVCGGPLDQMKEQRGSQFGV